MNSSERFLELFEGFPYAHGLDEGGCTWQIVDSVKIGNHLSGAENPIGIYPMVYDPHKVIHGPAGFIDSGGRPVYAEMQEDLWYCKWGSIDIDEHEESFVYATNAYTIFKALGVTAWMEVSRSKGYHLWVFAREWIPAPIMRKALLAVTQLGKVEFDAVYPKQDSLLGPPGNYMRIPYPNYRQMTETRQVIVDESGYTCEFELFLDHAQSSRASLAQLEEVARLWKPPVNSMPPVREYDKRPLMKIDGTRLRGLPRMMFDEGPNDYFRNGHGAGKGRHGFLNRFARALWEDGYEQGDVIAWLSKLDSQLGAWYPEGPKFEGRPDAHRQLENVAHQARAIAAR